MKYNMLLSIIIIAATSCGPNCIYKEENYLDHSLCISFKFNDTIRKFYQMDPSLFNNSEGGGSIVYDYNNVLKYYRHLYRMRFSQNTDRASLTRKGTNGDFLLGFGKGFFSSKNPEEYVSPAEIFGAQKFFSPSFGFNSYPVDTFFINGVFLIWIKDEDQSYMNTDNVFIRYKNNKDSILSYFKDCSISITNIMGKCGDYYIIEGKFETKLESAYKPGIIPTVFKLTEGKFRILRKFSREQ